MRIESNKKLIQSIRFFNYLVFDYYLIQILTFKIYHLLKAHEQDKSGGGPKKF